MRKIVVATSCVNMGAITEEIMGAIAEEIDMYSTASKLECKITDKRTINLEMKISYC